MELSEVEDRLSGLAAESDLCSSGWVASLNEKPHDAHATASGEISRWQRGQFTGGGLYHRVRPNGDGKGYGGPIPNNAMLVTAEIRHSARALPCQTLAPELR